MNKVKDNTILRRASEQEMLIFIIKVCIAPELSKFKQTNTYLTLDLKLVQKYKIEYVGEKVGYKFGSIMQPTKPLNIKLTRRKL